MNFIDHKKQTIDDCNQLSNIITEIGKQVELGDMEAFERFFIEGGTEEGDSKIKSLQELIVIRYLHRLEEVRKEPPSMAESLTTSYNSASSAIKAG